MCAGACVPSVLGMRIVGLLVAVLVCVTGCAGGGPAPDRDADHVAQVVALAIDFPRQDDAVGYARAAADTRAARDGRLAVVGVSASRLVLRVHFDAYEDDTSFTLRRHVPAVTTCYDVAVSVSGTGDPVRRTCPAHAAPVHLPPPPPVRVVPQGADAVVRAALRRRSGGAERVEAAVRSGLPAPARGTLAPEVRVAAQGSDVGVSVSGQDGCLLGSRVDGEVLVWRPSRVQVQPGELSCDPATALGRMGIDHPH
jgi:hypothetical protein